MRHLTLAALAAAIASAAPLAIRHTGFAPGADGRPAGWTTWSARPDTMPRTFVDRARSRSGVGALAISGNSNAAAHGGWEHQVAGVKPNAWYRVTAHYRAEGVASEAWQVVARVDWRDTAGKRAGQPEYVHRARRDGAWTRVTADFPAPTNASAAVLQLYLSNAPLGTVWWDEISLEEIPDPGPRKVTVASINLRPRNTRGPQESVGQFLEAIEASVKGKTDIILLPEGITVVGTPSTYEQVSEPIPGPTTERLAAVARARNTYVAAGIYEREGTTVYNTSVLLDRRGELVGKYRKVYLPREEVERGITPGNDYPVFRTDFGTVGMMICYDVFFADPARALATRGAEVILMPIWGGIEALGKARAIENGVFLAASGYDYPTYVMDPDGEILSQAPARGSAAISTIDLNRRYTHPHLGDMHSRRMKELRLDIAPTLPGLEQ